MKSENQWAAQAYPGKYQEEVNESIGFSGLGMDMFATGKAADILDLLNQYSAVPAHSPACLDIGCGIGLMHPLRSRCAGSLAGKDVSREAIDIAKPNNPDVEYRLQHDKRIPFEDASFDFNSTVCVMHHVPSVQWPGFVAQAF